VKASINGSLLCLEIGTNRDKYGHVFLANS